MEVDWLERWTNNRIAFHQQKVNSRLTLFWKALALSASSTVFVPLCGKTLDMLWLNNAGHPVIGNELSEIACKDFFSENNLDYSESHKDKFRQFSATNIELLQGDFFDLTPANLSSVRGVFDRAALVALPVEIRAQYAQHLAAILQPGCKILLISMEYDQSKMNGPPFSVTQDEIEKLFSPSFNVEVLSYSSGPEIVGNLKGRGLDTLDEKVYLLERLNTSV